MTNETYSSHLGLLPCKVAQRCLLRNDWSGALGRTSERQTTSVTVSWVLKPTFAVPVNRTVSRPISKALKTRQEGRARIWPHE